MMEYSMGADSIYKNVRCRSCDSAEFNCFETPFAMKVLIQELEAMGLSVRLSDEPFNLEEDAIEPLDEPDASDLQGGAEPPSFPPGETSSELRGGGNLPDKYHYDEGGEGGYNEGYTKYGEGDGGGIPIFSKDEDEEKSIVGGELDKGGIDATAGADEETVSIDGGDGDGDGSEETVSIDGGDGDDGDEEKGSSEPPESQSGAANTEQNSIKVIEFK